MQSPTNTPNTPHSSNANDRRALVLGGSGAVGREVVRLLRSRGVETAFTFHQSIDPARALAGETGARAIQVDLTDPTALRAALAVELSEGRAPDVLIHCAARVHVGSLADVTDPDWSALVAVNCHAPLVACQVLAPALAARGGDVVLVGAVDRGQSLPIPVAFAATQGMLATMAMALAKELGPRSVRVNLAALGLLTDGLSRHLDPKLVETYLAFSALRRLGTPREAAQAIVWLALENQYMTGKVAAFNGGI